MHRAYQSVLPCSSKYLQQKWDKAVYEEHWKKVQAAKPVVDTSAPPTYGHLLLKLKKLELEKDRLSIIERDNRLLLEKMSFIMRTTGRIDNKNDYEPKSLNRRKREQELLRITKENYAILERITKCQPQYKVQKWNEDWHKAEEYMNSIARYPRRLCKSRNQKKQKYNKKTPKRKKQKAKRLNDGCLTDKSERKEREDTNNENENQKNQSENQEGKV
ncbi:uncharacterized protein CFAP97D2 isoform X2 [Eublepharis macularius]|uniref:Uncharacterized protein CFAP97D2 isoform X2 n=1 Tax=Eublepharis macularius TaxID=481883 RepID=A0AA97J119_EUBMA|nr:uncharacterized protein CFAP97D2 isoform X2 [Eublepharis macularius]